MAKLSKGIRFKKKKKKKRIKETKLQSHHGCYNNDGKMRPVPLLTKRYLILKEDKTPVS